MKTQWKSAFSHLTNLIMVLFLCTLAYKQYEIYRENQRYIDLKVEQKPTFSYFQGQRVQLDFPSQEQNNIALFWSTTCAPCKLEMKRLQRSIDQGHISAQKIVAINPWESQQLILKYLKKNSFSFHFLLEDNLSEKLQIYATPTAVYFENGKIVNIKSGMSFTGIWQAESFLK
ncbi:redoxin domain-containing protein [Halobacteriovorax sp. GB3]|uniref:TlpA family protein disulfide reductase n=1 Tax=Halobacteriovorax sp. GB3 TaxID=2719615 RepID=UPI00235F1FB4|nr:redoxin domain-containing protein [Halobacteriovorax sp. GB3]MDD0851683.1 redoxin domain-containing protein [Halobacteriovorax sp. GB3]